MNLKHELYRIALDLALYSNDEFWGTITDHVWKEYMEPFSRDKSDTHPCSFRAIFCDEFPAAYFSFKWAEV
jgi:Zn-dependent oligopeptidase